jgi:hypothetical protein
VLVTSLFVDFMHRVLIEGFDPVPSMKFMLAATVQSPLAHHTNIVLLHPDANATSIDSTIYVFTHPMWCPWGHVFLLLAPNASLQIVGLTKSRRVQLILLHAGIGIVEIHAALPSHMGLNCLRQT